MELYCAVEFWVFVGLFGRRVGQDSGTAEASVYGDALAGGPGGLVGGEEGDGGGDVFGFAEAADGVEFCGAVVFWVAGVGEVCHGGAGDAGADGVYANFVSAEFYGECFGEGHDGAFGCGVDGDAFFADFSGFGCDVDDGAGLLFDHVGGDCAVGVDEAVDVYGDDVFPISGGGVDEEFTFAANSGCGYADIE